MKKRGRILEHVKAQVSLEFMMIVGVALLMTLPLILIFYRQSENINSEIGASQLDKVASEIRDAADEVYYLGSPSKKTVTVYMPEGVNNISITNNTIIFTVEAPGSDYELVKWSVTTLNGSLQTYPGIHHISVEAYDNYVQISD